MRERERKEEARGRATVEQTNSLVPVIRNDKCGEGIAQSTTQKPRLAQAKGYK